MQPPRRDPRRRPAHDHLSWDHVLVSYAMVAAIPALLWLASNPLAGGATALAVAGVAVGARRAATLVRYCEECRRLAVDVGDTATITVTRRPVDDAC